MKDVIYEHDGWHTCGAGLNYPLFRSAWDDPRLLVASLVFCVMFCISLFVLLSIFLWSLYCLSFDVRLPINALVSLNFSYNCCSCCRIDWLLLNLKWATNHRGSDRTIVGVDSTLAISVNYQLTAEFHSHLWIHVHIPDYTCDTLLSVTLDKKKQLYFLKFTSQINTYQSNRL